MKSITKQELISNLQDKISQFKSNFSKIKESRKEVPELNFEINRDALKLFYKNKSDNEVENQIQNQNLPKQQSKNDEIYSTKNKLNEKNQIPKLNQNIKNGEQNINQNEIMNNQMNIGAQNKKSYAISSKETYNNEINQKQPSINIKNNINNNNVNIKKEFPNSNINMNYVYNINVKRNPDIDNKDNLNNNIQYGEFKLNQNNKEFKRLENTKENNIIEHLNLNEDNNYQNFKFDGVKNTKKLEKREKSAPKISINQKINNFFAEKPLTYKKHENIRNINNTSNYNQLLINNNRKATNTEELYQKLLMNFNINSSSNKRDKSFYNLNFINNINNNNKYIREDNPNKSYGQINLRETNSLYKLNGNSNINYTNLQKRNYYRNGLNLDHLKDLYLKKTEDSKRPTQSMFKSKMDMFYQELNEYKNANYNKKKELKNYSKKNKYINNSNKYQSNTQYNEYINIKNNTNTNSNNYLIKNDINNGEKNIFNGNNIGYNEIFAVKNYLNELTKEEINNLPDNIKIELKDIFNILYQKLNE